MLLKQDSSLHWQGRRANASGELDNPYANSHPLGLIPDQAFASFQLSKNDKSPSSTLTPHSPSFHPVVQPKTRLEVKDTSTFFKITSYILATFLVGPTI
jgi:hypothetical protein